MSRSRCSWVPHSRLPVYQDTYDNVIGFVHVRDLLGPGVAKDAVPVRHESRRVASAVDVEGAREAAERLLAEREHVTYAEAETVLARHTRIA